MAGFTPPGESGLRVSWIGGWVWVSLWRTGNNPKPIKQRKLYIGVLENQNHLLNPLSDKHVNVLCNAAE
jgi:hypothetical protein